MDTIPMNGESTVFVYNIRSNENNNGYLQCTICKAKCSFEKNVEVINDLKMGIKIKMQCNKTSKPMIPSENVIESTT